MTLKGHLIAGQLVGPLAGIESGSANDLVSFDGSAVAHTESLSAYLDRTVSNTPGAILYRGASAWDHLPPANGYLKSASGVLSWAAVNSTGLLTAGTPLVQNPIAFSTTVTQAHGLGAVPVLIGFALECLTAELGYSVGDVVRGGLPTSAGSILTDATNVIWVSTTFMNVTRKDTFVGAATTAANWKLTLTPYKLT